MKKINDKKIVFTIILIIGIGSFFPIINGYNIQDISKLNENIKTDSKVAITDDISFDDYTDDVFGFIAESLNLKLVRTQDRPNVNIIHGKLEKIDDYYLIELEVDGVIENRGVQNSADQLIYSFIINASDGYYIINYCNQSLNYSFYTDFIEWNVQGSTLSVLFKLNDIDEDIYSVEIYSLDSHFDENSLEDFWLYIDVATNIEIDLNIDITRPTNSLYVFDQEMCSLKRPLIFGKFTFNYTEISGSNLIIFDELYVDGDFVSSMNSFGNLVWNKFSFGKHTIKVIAYDWFGNRGSDEMEVWKFF